MLSKICGMKDQHPYPQGSHRPQGETEKPATSYNYGAEKECREMLISVDYVGSNPCALKASWGLSFLLGKMR